MSRGFSDCCHYDEGYDEGFEDGKDEARSGDVPTIGFAEIIREWGMLPTNFLHYESALALADAIQGEDITWLKRRVADRQIALLAAYKEATGHGEAVAAKEPTKETP